MQYERAKEITRLMCVSHRLIESIKLLRADTSMGLLDAKTYLETHSKGGEEILLKILCEDFVTNKSDLLIVAKEDLRRLQQYIAQLEEDISNEEKEENHA